MWFFLFLCFLFTEIWHSEGGKNSNLYSEKLILIVLLLLFSHEASHLVRDGPIIAELYQPTAYKRSNHCGLSGLETQQKNLNCFPASYWVTRRRGGSLNKITRWNLLSRLCPVWSWRKEAINVVYWISFQIFCTFSNLLRPRATVHCKIFHPHPFVSLHTGMWKS